MTQTKPQGPTPKPPGGHWELLGHVGVNGCKTIAVCDPCYAEPPGPHGWPSRNGYAHPHQGSSVPCRPYGEKVRTSTGDIRLGVQFMAGHGDGLYEVWGWVTPECLAQIVITMT